MSSTMQVDGSMLDALVDNKLDGCSGFEAPLPPQSNLGGLPKLEAVLETSSKPFLPRGDADHGIEERSQAFCRTADGVESKAAAPAADDIDFEKVAAPVCEYADQQFSGLTLLSAKQRVSELFPPGCCVPVVGPKLPPVASEPTFELCRLVVAAAKDGPRIP